MDKETFSSPNHHNKLSSGDRITYMMYSVNNQNNPILFSGFIEDIRGGGFYGKALLLDNERVIKLSQPDAFHELFRRLNWYGEPFPSQANERAALLDHLSMRIAHIAIPVLTDGRVRTPQSYGYTHIPGFGFAQVIERMHGRGARFDTVEDENNQFHQIRTLLWDLSVQMGLEHGGQIHPDNPFGKPNLWKGDNGQFIWLDLLPAIPHTGLILPAFYFSFHNDIRERIGDGELTFNRIRTEKLKTYIRKHTDKFTSEQLHQLDDYIGLYEKTWNEYNRELQKPLRERVIHDALQRGMINESYAEKLRKSTKAYGVFFARTITDPALRALVENMQKLPPYKAMFNAEYQAKIRRFFKESDFRNEQFIEKFILYGPKAAYNEGLISQQEYEEAVALAKNPPGMSKTEAMKLTNSYLILQASYEVLSELVLAGQTAYLIDAAVHDSDSLLLKGSTVAILGWLVGSILRYPASKIVSSIRREDLHTATAISLLPAIGRYIAVAGDIIGKLGYRGESITHYTERYWVAKFSKLLRPWGGYNSDLEEQLWGAVRQVKRLI